MYSFGLLASSWKEVMCFAVLEPGLFCLKIIRLFVCSAVGILLCVNKIGRKKQSDRIFTKAAIINDDYISCLPSLVNSTIMNVVCG